jgi:hypothetical protein
MRHAKYEIWDMDMEDGYVNARMRSPWAVDMKRKNILNLGGKCCFK